MAAAPRLPRVLLFASLLAAPLLAAPLLAAPGLAAPVLAAPEATLEQARELYEAGDPVGAAMVLEVVTEREPDDGRAWHLMGRALHDVGRFPDALTAHETAAKLSETSAEGAYGAAEACARMERADDALRWLGKAQAARHPRIDEARTDPDFAALRADSRFAAMLPPLVPDDRLFVEDVRVIYRIDGEAAGDQFGWVARTVDDVDGDGVLDFAATAPSHTAGGPSAGRVYVYSGRSGTLLFHVDGGSGQSFGNSVAPAGDVDGDGTPDIVAGAPGAGPSGNGPGHAYVLSGKDGSRLLELSAGEANDGFGIKVCGLGDLDGDGHAELFVGAHRADAAGADSGRGYAWSGKDGELLFTIDGEAAGDNYGTSADSTRDREHRLLIVGAMNATKRQAGRAYVYRVDTQGAEPFFTVEPDATSSNLGQYFVAIAGDVDADGTPDVYASDWSNAARGPSTGRVFVHSGRTGERLLTLTGPRAGEGFGTSPSTAGDVDRDGHADFIVGAWQAAAGAPSGGACYLHSGKDGALLASYTNRQAGDTFGFDAVGIGDVDGDGGVDFLLTSGWSPVKGPKTGRVFVVAGPFGRSDRPGSKTQ